MHSANEEYCKNSFHEYWTSSDVLQQLEFYCSKGYYDVLSFLIKSYTMSVWPKQVLSLLILLV